MLCKHTVIYSDTRKGVCFMSRIDMTTVEIFTDMLPCHCATAEDMVVGARQLIHSTETAEGSNVLLARASNGNRVLLFMADRDNFEFSLRTTDRRVHVAGGTLASELHGISLFGLRQLMAMYLEQGKPIIIPDWKQNRRVMLRRAY